MQNKKTKDQIKKDLRRMHEQIGALVIVGGMLAGTIAISHEARRAFSGLVMHPAFAIVEHSVKEPEVAHRHMHIERAARSPMISGQ